MKNCRLAVRAILGQTGWMSTGSAPPFAGSSQWMRLCAIVDLLRDPVRGCPWDRVQSFATIAPYTIEEAYEVADAITRADMAGLCDELGDLLFQVVLHAKIAEQQGLFDVEEVARAIADKMERRHPHIFAPDVDEAHKPAPPGERPDWEALKARERTTHGALDGIALGLPALMRAQKIQKRAARTGFDWPDAQGPRAKILEELDEVDSAPDDRARAEEIGDLLFAVVNYARHQGVDAEDALRSANEKFIKRFETIEHHAGSEFDKLSLEDKELLWMKAKRST